VTPGAPLGGIPKVIALAGVPNKCSREYLEEDPLPPGAPWETSSRSFRLQRWSAFNPSLEIRILPFTEPLEIHMQDAKQEEKVAKTRRSSRRSASASAPLEEDPLPSGAPLGGIPKVIPLSEVPATVPENTLLPTPPRHAKAGEFPELFESCKPRGALRAGHIDAPRKQPPRAAKASSHPVRCKNTYFFHLKSYACSMLKALLPPAISLLSTVQFIFCLPVISTHY
jgi:hypothetical protein